MYHNEVRDRSTSPPAPREKGWAIDPAPSETPEPFRYHEVEAELYKIKHEKYAKKMMEDFKTQKSSWAIDPPPSETPERLRYADAAAEIYAAKAAKKAEVDAESKKYEGGEKSGSSEEDSMTPEEEKTFAQL